MSIKLNSLISERDLEAAIHRMDHRGRPNAINGIRINIPNLDVSRTGGAVGNSIVDISSSIAVIFGRNATGKSKLLRDLETMASRGSCDGVASWIEGLEITLGAARMQVKSDGVYASSGGEGAFDAVEDSELKDAFDRPSVLLVDPFNESGVLPSIFYKEGQEELYLNGLDAQVFEKIWLSFASLIVGRSYTRISAFELTGDDLGSLASSDVDRTAWFEVEGDSFSYSSREMSRAELSVLYLLWSIRSIRRDSIVFLDEPFLGIAGGSQAHFVSVLAFLSRELGHQFVIATADIAPFRHLKGARFIHFEEFPFLDIRPGLDYRLALRSIGSSAVCELVVLAEDLVAAHTIRYIIIQLRDWLDDYVDIFFSSGGESKLASFMKEFRPSGKTVSQVIVVFDGDQRSKVEGGSQGGARCSVLPGEEAPEEVFRTVLHRRRPLLTIDSLRKYGVDDPRRFLQTLKSAAGLDHHDWIRRMAESFMDNDLDRCCKVLVSICMEDEEFRSGAEVLVDDLEQFVRSYD